MKIRWFAACFSAVVLIVAAAQTLLLASAPADNPPPPPTEEKKADPFAVPNGTPKELMAFVAGLQKEVHDYPTLLKFRAAALEAANKILAGKPDEKERTFALEIKIQFTTELGDLTKLIDELKKNGPKKMVRPAEMRSWQMKLAAAGKESPEKLKKTINDAMQFLAASPLQPQDISLGVGIGQAAEQTNDQAFAAQTYQKLSAMFKKAKDEHIQKFAKTMEGVARRLGLLGKKIELSGKLLSGEKLDMANYKGKVVLVDFWATWCPPCVGEVPNVLKNYERYHDKGFEVIGISLDHKREDLENFIKEKKIPWATLYDDEPNKAVEYYGILAIPTTLLVSKDGKVVSLSARGEELTKLLEKYFPAEKK
jgi:thiol-disulfide isomerase/thioredoxin